MKYIINILLLVFVFYSCRDSKKNKLNQAVIISEEKKSFPIESVESASQKDIIDTLINRELLTNQIKLTLPTPDTAFFNNLTPPIEKIGLIEKYIKTHFTVTQLTKVIETTSADHPEGVWDCHTRTEYGNIAMEERTCELQLEKTVEFKNYSFKEVNSVLKILYPEVENKKWNDNTYSYDSDGGYGCSLEIINANDKILVFYGCSN